jgi:hypothetical protein
VSFAETRTACRYAAATTQPLPLSKLVYAASVDSSIGSTIEESSFWGLLTRVEIGHMRIRPAGKDRIKSPASLSRTVGPRTASR